MDTPLFLLPNLTDQMVKYSILRPNDWLGLGVWPPLP